MELILMNQILTIDTIERMGRVGWTFQIEDGIITKAERPVIGKEDK